MLALEDLLVELLLQTFVRQIDTQLFEAVFLEALESVDIKDSNGPFACLTLPCRLTIDFAAKFKFQKLPYSKQAAKEKSQSTIHAKCRQAQHQLQLGRLMLEYAPFPWKQVPPLSSQRDITRSELAGRYRVSDLSSFSHGKSRPTPIEQ